MGQMINDASKLHVQSCLDRALMPSGCMQANCAEMWLAMGQSINDAGKLHVLEAVSCEGRILMSSCCMQANCAELLPAVGRIISGCMRMLFQNLPRMDLEVSRRVAVWLAHHITNFDNIWPWSKWSQVLTAPASDPQRCAAIIIIIIIITITITITITIIIITIIRGVFLLRQCIWTGFRNVQHVRHQAGRQDWILIPFSKMHSCLGG